MSSMPIWKSLGLYYVRWIEGTLYSRSINFWIPLFKFIYNWTGLIMNKEQITGYFFKKPSHNNMSIFSSEKINFPAMNDESQREVSFFSFKIVGNEDKINFGSQVFDVKRNKLFPQAQVTVESESEDPLARKKLI